jgi:hypothetical protein
MEGPNGGSSKCDCCSDVPEQAGVGSPMRADAEACRCATLCRDEEDRGSCTGPEIDIDIEFDIYIGLN